MELIREVGSVPDGINNVSDVVEIVAAFMKTCNPGIKKTAQTRTDLSKCVSIVSFAFQLVPHALTLVEMGMKVKRAKSELPNIKERVENLRQIVMKSIIPVLHPDGHVEEERMKNMLRGGYYF